MQCEGAHEQGLHNKALQKYKKPTSHHVLILLSEHSLFDSNFPEAAYRSIMRVVSKTRLIIQSLIFTKSVSL